MKCSNDNAPKSVLRFNNQVGEMEHVYDWELKALTEMSEGKAMGSGAVDLLTRYISFWPRRSDRYLIFRRRDMV